MVTGFVELLHLHDSQTEGIANPESSCGIDMLASIAADLDLEPISRSEVVDGSTSDPIWGDAQAADVPKSGHGETNPSPWQSSGENLRWSKLYEPSILPNPMGECVLPLGSSVTSSHIELYFSAHFDSGKSVKIIFCIDGSWIMTIVILERVN
uniref:Uncharacterized protein n=1 Tax=Aegilops tauschii TaxID=37682 RepID=M8B6U4_AEGTA